MNASEIEHHALRVLSFALYSGLHHLMDNPTIADEVILAESAIGRAQAKLKRSGRSDRKTRAAIAAELADGLAPLAARGVDVDRLYTLATIAALPDARPRRSRTNAADVLRVSIGLFLEKMNAELGRPEQGEEAALADDATQRDIASAKHVLRAARSIAHEWEPRGALVEIAALVRCFPSAQAAFERLSTTVLSSRG
jgi:hypothetical protein